MKRILFLSDMHIGHKTGLCPPLWGPVNDPKIRASWDWFEPTVKEHGPYDCLVLLGDDVDRDGVKNSHEMIMNTHEQQEAVIYVVNMIAAPKIFSVYGTEVHVQEKSGHELEYDIGKRLGIETHKQVWIGVDDYVLDCRHHPAGVSRVYPGNPLQKEYEINQRWHSEGVQPSATHIIRGHTHSMFYIGVPNRWQGIACPALQDLGGRFGARCSSIIHYGFGVMSITQGEWPKWTVYEKPRQMEQVFSL